MKYVKQSFAQRKIKINLFFISGKSIKSILKILHMTHALNFKSSEFICYLYVMNRQKFKMLFTDNPSPVGKNSFVCEQII